MKASMIFGAVLLSTLGANAAAELSTDSEFRGYNTCLDAAELEVHGLVTSREYFINRSDRLNEYFINGTAWEEGDRVDVRLACETSRNGRVLHELAVSNGRFVLDEGQVNIRVASN